MGYHIIMDSVGDRTKNLSNKNNFSLVPLKIVIDDDEFIDDGHLDQGMLLERIKSAKECPRSACASPGTYKNIFKKHKEDRIYVITASSELTGSYNSAKLAEEMFLEDYPDAEIVVIDTKSASAGQTLVAYKIMEYEEQYSDFQVINNKVEEFIAEQNIMFVLEDINFLKQNGRLTGMKALLATALNIVPILIGDENGIIRLKGQARGIKRALRIFGNDIIDDLKSGDKDTIVISHCNSKERAITLKNKLADLFPDLRIIVVETGGISTLYAGDGGVVVSY
ncbi:MAG: DegV family protein [Epulopiscium sp.]|nr:DegV family protein [Candidatus Epulonipiscium sp.]